MSQIRCSRTKRKSSLSVHKDRKKLSCLWGCFNKAKIVIRVFFENGVMIKNDNANWWWNKLRWFLSVSIRCHGHTIFENEAVINISRPSFYSKILSGLWGIFFLTRSCFWNDFPTFCSHLKQKFWTKSMKKWLLDKPKNCLLSIF